MPEHGAGAGGGAGAERAAAALCAGGGRAPNWTDDLPKCQKSGFGNMAAQNYSKEGFRLPEHDYNGFPFYHRLSLRSLPLPYVHLLFSLCSVQSNSHTETETETI